MNVECLKINTHEKGNIELLINYEFILDLINEDNDGIMKEFIDIIEKKNLKEIVRALDFGKNLDDDTLKLSSSKNSSDIKRKIFNNSEIRITKQSVFIKKDFNNKNND